MGSTLNIQSNWRINVGLALFIISIGWIVLPPIMPFLGFSGGQIAAFSGFMVLFAELLLIAGAAIAGKDGFAYIKSTTLGFLKAQGPPQKVSRTRYRFGLVLFIVPLVFAWVSPYAGRVVPELERYPLAVAIAGDVLLLISLFVLGGEFWDKLRSLFVHEALPAPATSGKNDVSAT